MPLIRIEYDNAVLKDEAVLSVSNAVQKIVSDVTKIKDVFVYANSSQIKVKVAPIEIFVEMSASKIENLERLFDEVKMRLKSWKAESGFNQPINLTIIPMQWKFDVGI